MINEKVQKFWSDIVESNNTHNILDLHMCKTNMETWLKKAVIEWVKTGKIVSFSPVYDLFSIADEEYHVLARIGMLLSHDIENKITQREIFELSLISLLRDDKLNKKERSFILKILEEFLYMRMVAERKRV